MTDYVERLSQIGLSQNMGPMEQRFRAYSDGKMSTEQFLDQDITVDYRNGEVSFIIPDARHADALLEFGSVSIIPLRLREKLA